MATVGRCSSYSSSPTLALHRRHGLLLPQQPPQAARRRGRWPRLQASASAGGARALETIKAATDAEFFQPADTRPIMLFDGVCNLCDGGVRFVRKHDPNRRIRFVPLQSESGRKLLQRSGRAPDDISSVVLVEKDRSYIKSDAVVRIMEYLNLPFPQLAVFLKFVPLFLRDFAYDNVADNRSPTRRHLARPRRRSPPPSGCRPCRRSRGCVLPTSRSGSAPRSCHPAAMRTVEPDLGQQERASSWDDHGRLTAVVGASRLPCSGERLFVLKEETSSENPSSAATAM